MDPCHCDQIHSNDLSACDASAIGCELLCKSVALGAIAGCMAAGPFAVPCMIIVWAAHALCIANCLATYEACLLRAASAFLKCEALCSQSITP